MMATTMIDELFLNGLFRGQFAIGPISCDCMLHAFRNTGLETLKDRLEIIKVLQRQFNDRSTDYRYSYQTKAMNNLFGDIRPLLSETDLMKLIEIDYCLYDSTEFMKIYDTDPTWTRRWYEQYLDDVNDPRDIEIYLVPMKLSVHVKHLKYALRMGNVNQLQFIIEHTKQDELSLCRGDYDTTLFLIGRKKLVDYFGLIHQIGINLKGEDQPTLELIDQAMVEYPRLTRTKRAY